MSCFIADFGIAGLNAVALEDSIMQKDKLVTAGSKILENFIAPFDATVVSRLSQSQYELAGKTSMDEFGIFPTADKQNDILGAIQAVKDNVTGYSLCNDLFGRYRKQAAENNCCYIHPTYGTVSRFGLIPLASSIDQIGVVCKNLTDGFALLSRIAGNDPRDGAMFPEKSFYYTAANKELKIGIPKSVIQRAETASKDAIESFVGKFQTVDLELEHFEVYTQVMYILSCAEISNNINRYDGVKFGYRSQFFRGLNDLYIKTRSEGFGFDTKLAAIMGAMVLSQNQYVPYYEKALKVRRIIKESLLFDSYDIIVLPCKISDNPYENLSLYALPALAGLPSVSFMYNGQGIQLIANVKNENALLSAWEVCK
jgi:aspartyl-tRNA(Asn)/glutamyl-tRNA(Gln) amidotransferase subunit A